MVELRTRPQSKERDRKSLYLRTRAPAAYPTKANHHFHREPCVGHREVSGEASVAACMGRAMELVSL